MRILIALGIAIFLLGGTLFYTQFSSRLEQAPAAYQVNYSSDTYSLELLLSFDTLPGNQNDALSKSRDPSAPRLNSESLLVTFKGEPILARKDPVLASESLVLESIPGIELGQNELFFFARVNAGDTSQLAALKARVLCDEQVIAQAVFTNQPDSAIVYGTLSFDVGKSN